MGCNVLRCQNAVATVITDNLGTPRREYAVCWEHGAEITAGAEWRVDTGRNGNVILMGADLDAGELVFSGINVKWSIPRGSELEPRRIVTVKAKPRGALGDEKEQEITFEMSSKWFARLSKQFAEYAGDEVDDEDESDKA